MLKILIIRFSSIGDIVLTTPVIRVLKQQLPNAEIHYCTKENFKSIIASNPYIDKIFCYKKNLSALITELKKENYDFVVDLHGNLRSLFIKYKLGIKSFTFDKLNFRKWLLVNFKINKLPKIHIVERYMQTVKLLDVSDDGQGLDYFIPIDDEIDLSSLPSFFYKPYIAFAIGAQHFTKRLPLEKIIEFCSGIKNHPIIFLGGQQDADMGEKIIWSLKEVGMDEVYNACGKYNLNQSASIIKQSHSVVSNDTGLMHIAAAFRKKIYSVWGNTTPDFGMYPFATNYVVIENNNLSCRPCSKIGHSQCPRGHFKCMQDLVFPEIVGGEIN